VGADADITVFDPDTVADRSTIADPAQRSVGIEWVAVEGRLVATPEGPDQTVMPGRAIRSDITPA
jgi:N-acyl-D-aspartate/D-glutamate deacylase